MIPNMGDGSRRQSDVERDDVTGEPVEDDGPDFPEIEHEEDNRRPEPRDERDYDAVTLLGKKRRLS